MQANRTEHGLSHLCASRSPPNRNSQSLAAHAGRSGDRLLQQRYIVFAQDPVEKHLPIPVAPHQTLFGTGGFPGVQDRP